GYDINRFESDINREFICSICLGVLEDPLSIPGCDHIFCSLCILGWFERFKNCPEDRKPVTANQLQPPLRQFRNLLNELSIRCSFERCNQFVRLCELAHHEKVCLYNPAHRERELDCPKSEST